MFWSGNYVAVRELNFLLKEENVTLSQVLEADDILQECKADNKALLQFLTRPDILSELITLITEEPNKNVELTSQYRYASIAAEVLTSQLSMLNDRLSLDTAQMHRLCDFINKDPPLNPLLASYFSKTVAMLLQRSSKQDYYLYHIVCLRVLDFFKSRRDFLPNLLRHMSTSAIADTFKYFIRLEDHFNKIVYEWFEEHQFLECLFQIICGTYSAGSEDEEGEEGAEDERRQKSRDLAGVASANAAQLLCELIVNGAAVEECGSGGGRCELVARLQGEGAVGSLLQAIFTSPAHARRDALVNGCQVLLALLACEPIGGSGVERAVAPHLPLLHQALLTGPVAAVGAARLQAAALLSQLTASEVREVAAALMALDTLGVLLDMYFRYPHNNFLHAHVCGALHAALHNPVFRSQYARHLVDECDALTRLMDAFEEDERRRAASEARSGSAGHTVRALRRAARALPDCDCVLPDALRQRWDAFQRDALAPLDLYYETPLGGYYPADNCYEVDNMVDANYEAEDAPEDVLPHVHTTFDEDDEDKMESAKNDFLQLASQQFDEFESWGDADGDGDGEGETEGEARANASDASAHAANATNALDLFDPSPWLSSEENGATTGEGWAQFEESAPSPSLWEPSLVDGMKALRVGPADGAELANNLLTAMSSMTPHDIANIVNANMPSPSPHSPNSTHSPHSPHSSPPADDANS